MNILNLYTLTSKLSSSTFQAHSEGLDQHYGEFDENRLIRGDFEKIDFPIVFRQVYGTKLTDLLQTGWPSLYLISERLKAVFIKYQFSGYRLFSVVVFNKNEEEIKGYYGLSISGKCGAVNYDVGEIVEKRLVPNGPICKYRRGIHIDTTQWDGSDFFMPEKSILIVVTTQVAQIIKALKLSNVILQRLSDIEVPIDT
jgi:hypothetical protein